MDRQTEQNLLKIVRNNYQTVAEEFNVTRKKEVWPEIKELAAEIKDGDKVLDVGCGNGRLLEALTGRNIEYLGIDQSQNLIELAKTNHPLADFRTGDLLDLGQIDSHGFDHVFCLAVFHHLPSDKLRIQALKQLKNKVGFEGRIIISVWNLWGHRKYRSLIWKFFFLKLLKKHRMKFGDVLFSWKNSQQQVVSQRYYHAFRTRQLKDLAKRADLKITKLYHDKYNYWLILEKKK
ncbi:MAG: class I SAM-dependent methyltransferase [Patescibacteria group bacterium]